MIRRPPRSTRTDTLFPYTTLFRSGDRQLPAGVPHLRGSGADRARRAFGNQEALADDLGRGCSGRSEEHTSELQSLMRISYAVFCLKKKKYDQTTISTSTSS